MNNQNIFNHNINSSQIIPFTFENTSVRVFNINDEAWFAASDVAKALGYANPLKAIRVHCKGVNEMGTPSAGGLQTIKIIPERDVYRLVMRSKLPSAEQFEEKVVGEILPSIRKTGGYMVTIADETAEQTLSRGLLIAKDTIDRQTQEIAELKPKAEGYDRLASSDGMFSPTEAAKILQIRRKDLFAYLHQNGWTFRWHGNGKWTAYSDRVKSGDLFMKVTTFDGNDGTPKTVEDLKITPKGLAKLSKIFFKESV